MAANISSGNIGTDARNDIAWRRQWVARLTEAEQYFDGLFKTNTLPYILFYSTEIIPGAVNYQTETQALSINTNLRILQEGRVWLSAVEKALQAVYDGLHATGRQQVWELGNWLWTGVTNLKPFERKNNQFAIVAELVNSHNKIIGRANFQSGGTWEFNRRGRPQISISGDDRKQVSCQKVKADDITDNLTIRIASVNGRDAVSAAQAGVLQIKALNVTDSRNNITYRTIVIEDKT